MANLVRKFYLLNFFKKFKDDNTKSIIFTNYVGSDSPGSII